MREDTMALETGGHIRIYDDKRGRETGYGAFVVETADKSWGYRWFATYEEAIADLPRAARSHDNCIRRMRAQAAAQEQAERDAAAARRAQAAEIEAEQERLRVQARDGATDRQVEYILDLLARRERDGEGGGFMSVENPTRENLRNLSRRDASNYINSLTSQY